MLYLSFKFVRKFKFCVSPLVKRYPDVYGHSWSTFIYPTCTLYQFNVL